MRVKMTSRKSSVKKKVFHFGIPRSRSLLKTIKRFLQEENNDRVILDISKRFFHIYFLLQIPMKIRGFNIHLKYLPHLCEATRARTRQMELFLATGEKVSL
jgi:hypothetical protein